MAGKNRGAAKGKAAPKAGAAKESPGARLSRLALSWPVGTVETPYSRLRIEGRGSGVMVYLDETESSYIDLADARRLEFEYHQHMDLLLRIYRQTGPAQGAEPAAGAEPAEVAEKARETKNAGLAGGGEEFRALHLGACACALPGAWARTYPRAVQVAVEIDPVLAENARAWFDLPTAPALRIRQGDGAEVLAQSKPGAWQVIVRDAFAAGEVPPAFSGPQFHQDLARALAPGGIYLANVAYNPAPTGAGLRLIRADGRVKKLALQDIAALRQVGLEHIVVLGDPKVWAGHRLGNLVIGASSQPWDHAEIDRQLRRLPIAARLFSPPQ